ncbi:MAG: D-tyrosyl-tRNA(Tyr) deacylase [Acidobacteria bacterium]|nr:D-tyrosyl-tRNA(Tyr) deacylase [Acidobacteriota bacterium]
MKAVVQRVRRAQVTVAGEVTGRIETGLAVLLGVGHGDTEAEADYLVEKIIHLRIFEDASGKMNHSLVESGGGLLVVSQFTLFGDVRKGRRPSFEKAARPEEARRLYQHFLDAARLRGINVQAGIFQAEMQLELVNDGPVTILCDSPSEWKTRSPTAGKL